MSKERILEDWSEYDDRKNKKGDANFFSCEESWEVDYLIAKIRKSYPNLSEQKIRQAISECCKTDEVTGQFFNGAETTLFLYFALERKTNRDIRLSGIMIGDNSSKISLHF